MECPAKDSISHIGFVTKPLEKEHTFIKSYKISSIMFYNIYVLAKNSYDCVLLFNSVDEHYTSTNAE